MADCSQPDFKNVFNYSIQKLNAGRTMKAFLELLIKQLVDDPTKIKIQESTPRDNTIELILEVDRDDVGKVIGKSGRNVNAIRTLLTAAGAKNKHRVTLQVLE